MILKMILKMSSYFFGAIIGYWLAKMAHSELKIINARTEIARLINESKKHPVKIINIEIFNKQYEKTGAFIVEYVKKCFRI